MVRDASFVDIPGIVLLLQEAYLKTHYAKTGAAEIDVAEAKRLLVAAIQRHGSKNGGGCWVQVADGGASINGLIVGTLARVYSIGNRLMASDLFWLTNEHADPRDAAALMKGMIGWAQSCPHVVEIKCGTTDIIADDPAAAGKMLIRLGMKQSGNLYRMEVAR